VAYSKIAACFGLVLASHAYAGTRTSFMPENDLGKMQSEAVGGITKAQFNAVIDRAEAIYKPIIAAHGGTLVMHRNWDDSTVNAYAEQNGSNWEVSMFGGLAKRPEVTEDGFAMVLCHEIGHHLGGFPYVQDWAADEGQSDMHATGAHGIELAFRHRHLCDHPTGRSR